MNSTTVRRLTAAIAIAIAAPTFAHTSYVVSGFSRTAETNPAIDRVFATYDRTDSPGCALAVFRNGAIAYERGYGMADLEHDVPIAPDTVFYIGSVSKQFTAFAAARAIQQGLLAADDSIRKYLPELPDYAQWITVRHLVHHTSGLRDFYTLLAIAGRRQDELFDNAAVLRAAARQKNLNFPPGSDYLYSNTGYALLATIVGRAAGSSFGAFVDANIFKPLGMTSSHVHDDESRLVKRRAYGYTQSATGELRLDTPAGERVGAGGVFTTVRDLLRWDENFYDARVGGRALIDRIQVPGALADGTPLTYAWGLQIATYRGQPIVEHGGSLGGYRAHLIRFPAQHVSIASLCNLAAITPATLARQVADVVLADRLTEPKPAAAATPQGARGSAGRDDAGPAVAGSAALFDYTGAYYSDEIDATFTVTAKDGHLLLRRDPDADAAPLQLTAPNQFRFRGMTVRFTRAASGIVEGLVVDAGRVRDIRFVKR